MTAPMKFEKSVTSPIAMASTSLRKESFILAQTDFATYAREAAEHFWPWNSNAPRISAVRTTAGSAVGWARTKSLPPVSPTIRG